MSERVKKARAEWAGDPNLLPDQRFVQAEDDGSITVEYPSAFMPPALNDLIHGLLTADIGSSDDA